MNKKDCILRTDALFSERRSAARLTLAAHEKEIAEKVPEIVSIERAMRETAAAFFASALDKEMSEAEFNSIKTRSLDLQKRRAELLYANGYPIDYLDLQFACPDCEDEGFVGGKMCHCYKKALSEQLLDESHMKTVARGQTFKSYDLTFFDGDDRDKMKKVLEYCKKYAAGFSSKSPNLLMMGTPGSGKTYLSCAIGTEVIDGGAFVVYAPMQEMLDAFEGAKFGKNPDADTDCYTDCDLLIIDDLGTEVQNAFSENILYNVINTRLNLNRPMIISTNCTPDELRGMYHDRLTSRLVYEFVKIPFCSKDIRHEKEARRAGKK